MTFLCGIPAKKWTGWLTIPAVRYFYQQFLKWKFTHFCRESANSLSAKPDIWWYINNSVLCYKKTVDIPAFLEESRTVLMYKWNKYCYIPVKLLLYTSKALFYQHFLCILAESRTLQWTVKQLYTSKFAIVAIYE